MRYTTENTIAIGKPFDVFVNGVKAENVIIADTDRGEAIYYPVPVRLHKNKPGEIYSRKLRGDVTVKEIPNDHY